MATHGMHNTMLSQPIVMHRVAWVRPVHHQENSKSDVLDEGVEHHNGVGEVSDCHETMVLVVTVWSSSLSTTITQPCACTMVCGVRCVMGCALPMMCVWLKAIGGTCGWLHGFSINMCASLPFITNGTHMPAFCCTTLIEWQEDLVTCHHA